MEGVINGETWFAGNITMMQEEGEQLYEENTVAHERRKDTDFSYEELVCTEISIFGIADTIKDTAKDIVSGLRSLGIKTVMLTGDNQQTANKYIARLVQF